MHRLLLTAVVGILCCPAVVVLRAQDSWGVMEAKARAAIVKIRVIGNVDGKTVSEIGTGFLIKTLDGPRVITAGHVLLPDSKWDDLKDRLIYVKQVGFGSSIEADPVTEATVQRDVDMAQIYLQPFNASTLSISTAEIPAGGTVDVGSWANDDRNAKFQVVELLSIHDPDHLHLSGIYVPSHSGSPVLDGQGRVAGMLVERVTSIDSPPATIGLALPAKSLMQVLSPVIPSRQTKKTELAPRNVVNFAQLTVGRRAVWNMTDGPHWLRSR
jgi:hypothetical protein